MVSLLSGTFFVENIIGIAFFAILFIFCEICIYLSNMSKRNIYFLYKIKKIPQKAIMLVFIGVILGAFFSKTFNVIRIIEIEKHVDKEKIIIGTICNEGTKNNLYWQYTLRDCFINGEKIHSKVLLRSKSKLEYGSKIKSKARYSFPKGARNQNGFDYSKYLSTLDIYIIAESMETVVLDKKDINIIENVSYTIRNKVREFTSSTLNSKEAGILNALLIGDETLIDENLQESYKKAGMIHLLVVSGGHTAFLLVLIKYILSIFDTSKNLSKFICLGTMILYIFITGVTPSIFRAGIGVIIVIIGNLIGRENDGFTNISLVALILFINNPNIVFSLSFLLSFGGTLGIVICFSKVLTFLEKIPKRLREPIALTISAQLFVTPIILFNFNVIYFGGLISNIFSMNLAGLIMMGGVILFIVYLFFPPLVFLPMKIISALISLMNKIAEIFGNVEWLNYYGKTSNILPIIIFYIILLYIFIDRKNNSNENNLILLRFPNIPMVIRKNKNSITVVLGVISIIILNSNIFRVNNGVEISVIDVGHGDSILITMPKNKSILIDTGNVYYQGEKKIDSGEQTIIPYLLKRGIKSIDFLILTHMDSDHVGGFYSIATTINVKQLGLSINSGKKEEYKEIKSIAQQENIKIKSLERGDRFVIDEVSFEILMPQKVKEVTDENNDSVVVLMEYKDKKTLFMGDLENGGEEFLLEYEDNLDIDILKLGHHGSRTSSTEEFIKATSPEISLISVGNRFKSIPAPEVLDRLGSIQSKIYRTDQNGEIDIFINENDIEVKTKY